MEQKFILQVIVGLLLSVTFAAKEMDQGKGPACDRCIEIMTEADTKLNSTESVNFLMNATHNWCFQFWGERNLTSECLNWYYNNYEILVQMWHKALDGLAWDILEPNNVCSFIGVCEDPPTTQELSKTKFDELMGRFEVVKAIVKILPKRDSD